MDKKTTPSGAGVKTPSGDIPYIIFPGLKAGAIEKNPNKHS
jgi:hypothetical protein